MIEYLDQLFSASKKIKSLFRKSYSIWSDTYFILLYSMLAKCLVCHKCWSIFPNWTVLNNHVKRMHQVEAKRRFRDGIVNHVKRGAKELFPCLWAENVLYIFFISPLTSTCQAMYRRSYNDTDNEWEYEHCWGQSTWTQGCHKNENYCKKILTRASERVRYLYLLSLEIRSTSNYFS